MLEFNGQPVYNAHGVIEYYRLYATKNNGVRVEFDLTKDELKTLIDKVEKTETVEEAKERIVKDYIKEELKQDPSRLNELKSLVDRWSVDSLYKTGDIVTYNGTLYTVIQDHTSQSDWVPDSTPSLYKKTNSTTENTDAVLQEFTQPTGAHDSYKNGDKVIFNNKVYESIIDDNVWSPETNPKGWKDLGGLDDYKNQESREDK